MKLRVCVCNSELAPDKVRMFVVVDGTLPVELSADEAAERLKNAWGRVVMPVQGGLTEAKILPWWTG